MVRRRIRPTCLESSRRSRSGHSSRGRSTSSARNLLVPERFCPRDWNFSANGLCWAKAVSQGDPITGA
ncbi:Uncharacterised protein [Mycobacterium tuberculosis]|uniref:Uncharacterized protein n=1 Tax=Mycobacterium tuberculosis TaxID=1773 RepID=A0A0U0SLT1_MYCTX|nr:Uncharacterised protein [Mycobacterium tuberculosis]